MGRVLVVALAAAAAGSACAPPEGEETSCAGGKCDSAGSKWKAQIDGRKDPIAGFLRASSIDDAGQLDTDYGRIVKAIAELQGCTEASIKSYIVSDNLISGVSAFPRIVSTVCSDDLTRASDFFIAASFPEDGTRDIDPHRIEMFAWDPDLLKYNFYAADPDEGQDTGMVQVDPKPDARPDGCQTCHLTPRDLASDRMPMTPIMNELTRPWVHWNAEPDAVSFQYEVPDETKKSPHFREYASNRQTSAARLEKIILAGHARVASARIRDRRTMPATVDASMAMLRPLFCEEQVNYATEDFESGVITVTSAVPGGLREAYVALSASGWRWNWLTDGNLRFAATTGDKLVMVPIRGNADIETEKALVSATTLTPQQVMRIRALDWKTPVFSSFRCNLWKDAASRFAGQPPRLDPAWRNSDAMRFLFDEIMKLDGTPLKPAEMDNVIALDVADTAKVNALKTALKAGPLPKCTATGTAACSATPVQLGDAIDSYVTGLMSGGRASLLATRNKNLCKVVAQFKNKPGLPAVTCP